MSNDFFKNKILGIQQPFFFPYLEYFALIFATDYWIVFDTPQFVKRAWFNRNRILDLKKGPKYITVPVHKHALTESTNKVKIHSEKAWNNKIISQLEGYKSKAPYYTEVIDFLNETLKPDFEYLSELNTYALEKTCKFLGVDFKYEVYSKMDLNLSHVNGPDEWGLRITKAMGASKFINALTGQKFIDRKKYQENGVDIKFLKYYFEPYKQLGKPFEPGLSVIDAMMFNSPEEIREMLNNYQLV